jgi:hypothetical protein
VIKTVSGICEQLDASSVDDGGYRLFSPLPEEQNHTGYACWLARLPLPSLTKYYTQHDTRFYHVVLWLAREAKREYSAAINPHRTTTLKIRSQLLKPYRPSRQNSRYPGGQRHSHKLIMYVVQRPTPGDLDLKGEFGQP